MSRLLSELLAAEEPLFGMAIKQMEQVSGDTSVDVRLTAEIVGKVHMKMRSLGLDPSDTSGPELYHALFNLVRQHDDFIAKRIGISDNQDVKEVISRVSELVLALDIPTTAWVLKPSVAKRLLKKTPPKRVMKRLGYRSIDSMIKRESVHELFAAMRFIESKKWLDDFIAGYEKLTPSDFETRQIQIVQMSTDKWGDSAMHFVQQNRHNITHLKEVGAVAILPLPIERISGITLITLTLLLHYINEIRVYSSFFKSQQMKADFARTIVSTLVHDPGKHAKVGNQQIHWRVVHRHFGSVHTTTPDIFQPHIETEDLLWRKTEEVLYRLEPALHFWYDIEYAGVLFGDRPVSFNLMDMVVSYVNNAAYGNQSVQHMRDSIWNEIYLRYVREQAVEKQVLKQLQQTNDEIDMVAFGVKGDF